MLYAYALAYLAAPQTFNSVNVIETISALPGSVKYAGRAILAAPFAFHSLNGVRHLSWDVGKCECNHFSLVHTMPVYLRHSNSPYLRYENLPVLTLKGAYSSGYTVLGATAVSTVALLLM